MELFAVAGNPVLHSKSPEMFNALFSHLLMDAVYCRLAAFDVMDMLATARAMGLRGLNVTAPFKEEVIDHLDGLDPAAEKIGAVNTVVRRDNKWIGYNTDYLGVLGTLVSHGTNPQGKKALVIGAGGAARAAVYSLCSAGAHTTVTNRTFRKAENLAYHFGAEAAPLDEIGKVLEGCDILLSAIPSSDRVIHPSLLRQGLTVIDANYRDQSTLLSDAEERGCTVIAGSEWLLFQAVAAVPLFTGRTASVTVMRKALGRPRDSSGSSIALIGFMGAGKSAVASVMAERYGTTVIDVDREIERKAGCSVAEIFEKSGEGAFRQLEKQVIGRLKGDEDIVVACGGGTVLDSDNARYLKGCARTVWLWVGPDTALSRLTASPVRPLLAGTDAQARVSNILEARLPFYANAADMIVNTEGKTVWEIAERIWNESR